MRSRKSFFVLSTAVSSAVFVIAACGGSGKEGGDPKTPGSSGDPAATSAPSGASSSGAGGGSSGGPTTTTTLGDAGDLQGAKLSEKSHSEVETKGEGGPKSTGGGSSNEAGRTAKDIQTIVAGKRDEARACYDKALAANKGGSIEGDLDIKWVIDPQGNVTDAAIDSTKSQILEPSVGNCIIEIIKKIKFNPSAKGYETRAHYPFNFHPKGGAAKDAGK